jgi:hypothetical protein
MNNQKTKVNEESCQALIRSKLTSIINAADDAVKKQAMENILLGYEMYQENKNDPRYIAMIESFEFASRLICQIETLKKCLEKSYVTEQSERVEKYITAAREEIKQHEAYAKSIGYPVPKLK